MSAPQVNTSPLKCLEKKSGENKYIDNITPANRFTSEARAKKREIQILFQVLFIWKIVITFVITFVTQHERERR